MATLATNTVFASQAVIALSATKKGVSVNEEAASYKDEYDTWVKEFSPMEYVEYDGEDGPNMLKVKAIPNNLVWTDHGTCEDEVVSNGFHFFGDPPRCCWNTNGWYISEVPWSEDPDGDLFEQIKISFYTWCSKCNDEGENDEGTPDCEECEGDGWTTHYFD